MLKPVLRLGEPALRAAARPVGTITTDVHALIDDMIETMHAAPGIGLAAPQIGVPLRVFVIDLSVGRTRNDLIELVDPFLVERDGMQIDEEGCLSVPGFTAAVARPARVVVRGFDRHGRPQTYEGTQLLARAFQHEMDHLNGQLFLDRVRGIRRDSIERTIQKLRRAGKW